MKFVKNPDKHKTISYHIFKKYQTQKFTFAEWDDLDLRTWGRNSSEYSYISCAWSPAPSVIANSPASQSINEYNYSIIKL